MNNFILFLIILFVLLIITIIIFVIVSLNGPSINPLNCLSSVMPINIQFFIFNKDLYASDIPSLNQFYNLTFRATPPSSFIFSNGYIALQKNPNIVWTAFIFSRQNNGYARLDTKREGDSSQIWQTNNGRIFNPSSGLYATLSPSAGIYYINLVTNIDESGCRFTYPSIVESI